MHAARAAIDIRFAAARAGQIAGAAERAADRAGRVAEGAAQRAAEGEVALSLEPLVVERNVLEWRFDPRSDARIPEASYDLRVIVLCQEGYTSSLAADALQSLGIHRATDVVGGFAAWRAAGLPVAGVVA